MVYLKRFMHERISSLDSFMPSGSFSPSCISSPPMWWPLSRASMCGVYCSFTFRKPCGLLSIGFAGIG